MSGSLTLALLLKEGQKDRERGSTLCCHSALYGQIQVTFVVDLHAWISPRSTKADANLKQILLIHPSNRPDFSRWLSLCLSFCFCLHDCTQVCVCVSTDIHYKCPHKVKCTGITILVGTFIVNISADTETHLSTIMQIETERQTGVGPHEENSL